VSIVRQLYQLQLVDTESDEKEPAAGPRGGQSGGKWRGRPRPRGSGRDESHLHELRKKLHAQELNIAGSATN